MNTPVSFELAKLLKEKGFDEQTYKHYVQVFKDTFKLTHNRMWEMDEESGFQNTPHYSAPTLAEVVMWLYEKHEIWIEVVYRSKLWGFSIKNIRTDLFELERLEYDSLTQAYEEAIEYVLKNLI